MQAFSGALPDITAGSRVSAEHTADGVQRRPSKLRGVAILHLEGVEAMGQRCWSREVALTTLDLKHRARMAVAFLDAWHVLSGVATLLEDDIQAVLG